MTSDALFEIARVWHHDAQAVITSTMRTGLMKTAMLAEIAAQLALYNERTAPKPKGKY
jgi:hypothetical protein